MAPNLKCAACCVCGKKRKSHPDLKLHLFPKDAKRCLQWVKALKITFQKHTQAICSDHFDGVHFGSKGQLLPSATPRHTDGHEEQPATGFLASSHNTAAIDLEPMDLELSSTQIVLPHYDLNTGFSNIQEDLAAEEETPRKRLRVELNRNIQPPPEECGSIQPLTQLHSVPQATHVHPDLQAAIDECAPHCTAPAPHADFGCEPEGVGGNSTRPSSSPKYSNSPQEKDIHTRDNIDTDTTAVCEKQIVTKLEHKSKKRHIPRKVKRLKKDATPEASLPGNTSESAPQDAAEDDVALDPCKAVPHPGEQDTPETTDDMEVTEDETVQSANHCCCTLSAMDIRKFFQKKHAPDSTPSPCAKRHKETKELSPEARHPSAVPSASSSNTSTQSAPLSDQGEPAPPTSESAVTRTSATAPESAAPAVEPVEEVVDPSTTSTMPAIVHPLDFGNVVAKKRAGEKMDAAALKITLQQRWVPTTKSEFPTSQHQRGGQVRTRRANNMHLSTFSWLAISNHPEHWGAWCVSCVLFATGEAGGRSGATNQRLGNLVARPLRDFSNLTGTDGDLSKHNRNEYHLRSSSAAAYLLQTAEKDSVSALLTSANARQVQRTRAALCSIVDTVKFAALQNIPLRGHRDDGRIDPSGELPPSNDGNFRMLLRFRVQSGDKELQEHLKLASSTALYTSKTVQNELLDHLLRMLQDALSAKISASPLWAVMADETTDRAHREQLVIAVRYLDVQEGKHVLREDPITLVDVFEQLNATDTEDEVRLSGENLAKVILGALERLRLDKKYLVAQCYDGAAAMSSVKLGVASHVQQVAPLAHYYHCAMHGLNLAASRMSFVRAVKNAQGTMETVIVFVTDSAKRTVVLQQAQKRTGRRQQRLIKLCETRFVERYTSVHRFCEQFPAIVDALRLMTNWNDNITSAKASMLLKAMEASDFLVAIVVMKALASLLRPLSQKLQHRGADLIQTLSLVRTTISTLTEMRTESSFQQLMVEAQTMADELETTIEKPRIPAHRSTFRANSGEDLDVTGYYRVNIFFPAIDAVQQDMEERFGSTQPGTDAAGRRAGAARHTHHTQAFSLSAILPTRVAGASWEDIRPGWELFLPVLPESFECDTKAELQVYKAMWRRNQDKVVPDTAVAALDHCDPVTFPTIHRLLQILAVLPVSAAEAERTFSKVTRTLTEVRATMGEERLEALVMCQTHRDLLPASGKVVDFFMKSGSGTRRAQLK